MKKRGKFRYSMFAKTIAFILTVLCTCACAGGAIVTWGLADGNIYLWPEQNVLGEVFQSYGYSTGRQLLEMYVDYGRESMGQRLEAEDSNVRCRIRRGSGSVVVFNNYQNEETLWSYSYTYENRNSDSGADLRGYEITIYVLKDMSAVDQYYMAQRQISLLYEFRYAVPAVAVGSGVLAILLFVYLLCAVGHRYGEETIKQGFLSAIPTDVLTVAAGGVCAWILSGVLRVGTSSWKEIVLVALALVVILVVFVSYCTVLAVKCKAGTVWKKTVLYWMLSMIGVCFEAVWGLVKNLPYLWKTTSCIIMFSCIELLCLTQINFYSYRDTRRVLLLWAVEKVIVVPIVLYFSLVMRKLQNASERLAEGELDYQVNTSWMVFDFEKHGENLNRIAAGMGKAVEARMKSEHLKTELITNVSHDIKTPLTSIINYSDLICKENTDNEKVQEYAEVLYRQSTRLKKLIEDLVEASKASTGNLEATLEACEVGILLTQAVGEFEQRLQEKDIDIITKQPETPTFINADGKLLWRVFDNLMNNICKYAQRGTRVYLSVEKKAGKAVVTFKNISEYPLDISAEELMERFVRGDRSRHTEGNGLGLSIARSLIDLQNGNMELVVDGDLFKVILTFPLLPEEAIQKDREE